MSIRLFAVSFLILALVSGPVFFRQTCRGETPSSSRSHVAAAAVKAQERERLLTSDVTESKETVETEETSEPGATEPSTSKKPGEDKKEGAQKKKGGKSKGAKAKGSAKAGKPVQNRQGRAAVAPPFFLRLEQAARHAAPDVVKGLTTDQRFSRRLPPHWSEVDVTEDQKLKIYAVQEAYFLEIVQLEARMERLKQERDAAMFQVLGPRQQARLEQILSTAATKRGGEVVEIIFDDEEE